MDNSGASCYVYAKASGMLAKSFVGPRTVRLFSIRNLQDLWHTLFTAEMPAVPQSLLARAIEQKAGDSFIHDFIKLVEAYSVPEDILVALIRYTDYNNLKAVGSALATGKTKMPVINDISPYNYINYSKWPDIKAMTAGSPLSWYNKVPDVHQQQEFDTKLDRCFLNEIFSAIDKLPEKQKKPVKNLFVQYFSMMNIIWVLRLKVYYNMSEEQIADQILFFDPDAGKSDIIASGALKIIDKDPSNYDDWKSWKYAHILNPFENGVKWKIDPAWLEERANVYFYKKVGRAFHKYPFTPMVLVSWFFIKNNELNCIRSVTEAIRLNADEAEMAKLAAENM